MHGALAGKAAIEQQDLKAALDDFIPPSYPTEIELQDLAAVTECTSRALLPARYRDMDRGELIRRIKELGGFSRE
jgi:hypothetical protein